ncbi:tyrosine-type recombinase/integrase [Gordonia insulae]|uniref:Prophage phiRv2 integrase n=1 Tax=Gordonia insulae TaxID=2420509 RepID=A0A3G8JKQ0_9ACTN|nr:site-specific integrase [Gordonia insulae]AZG45644.1 Putative prophage phiRv2 integrase [Gordonia insulae]
MGAKRNDRQGVHDRWTKLDPDTGNRVPSARHGTGLRWLARWVVGNREYSKAFARKIDAQEHLNSVVTKVNTGTYTDPNKAKASFRSVADSWLAAKKNSVKPKTYAGYKSILDVVVLPKWGDVAIGEIDHLTLQEWFSSLTDAGVNQRRKDKGLSESRISQTHQLMSSVFKFAIRSKLIAVNPADGIELARDTEESEERVYLSHADVNQLALACGRHQLLVLTLAYTGIRFGEAVALRAKYVTPGRIRVRSSVTEVAGLGLVEGKPKNHQERDVPVPAFLSDRLMAALPDDPDALVFPSLSGGFLRNSGEFRSAFQEARKTIGQHKLVPHGLRHTAASLAISAGANVKVIQRMLGHKSATMTLDLYGHLMPDDLGTVADALDRARADALRSTADQLRTGTGSRTLSVVPKLS